jgi:hypothetical protein
MAIGKISGPLLKENLIREGVDLAFETDLLYFDVNNKRIGIRTTSPSHDLQVNGTTRTTFLEVTTSATIADIVLSNNQIYSNTGTLNLSPGPGSHVVYQNKLLIDDIKIEGNRISAVNSNANLEFVTSGTGRVNIQADTQIFGNLHATGTITADGNLTLGDADTDSIDFKADIASNIIPDIDDTYRLGSVDKRWNDVWVNNLNATNVVAGDFEIDGIDITLRQGNIFYVSVNGDDGNTGTHQNDPLSSVGRALDLASAGDTVYIYPGTYSEALPLTVPVGVTVKGAGIRSVTIQPDSDVTVDVFLLNGETTVEDLTVTGFEYDVGTNTGYAFRFASNITVTSRSPYIRNISVITAGSTVRLATNPVDDPRGFLAGDAGKGAYVDGSVANSASREASMLFHSVTFITPGVDAITMTNGVRVEWLNSFTYFADKGMYAVSGSAGFANNGKTRLKVYGISAETLVPGDTISVENVTGPGTFTTGTIESVTYETPNTFIVIDGKVSGFEESLGVPDTSSQQIITFSGGQTASHLAFADYSDFGAEIRSIASASVYGNYGAYGDGEGVIGYLITSNFAYIGAGRFSDNDPGDVIQANEVVELNRAKLFYTSVDARGDFRVGDYFYVNQQTGDVVFNSTNLEIQSPTGIVFTDGPNTTSILPTKIETGNIRISGNTIESIVDGITLTAANNLITATSNVSVTGTLTVSDNIIVNGNTVIGDSSADTVAINSQLTTSLVPAVPAAIDLGTASLPWRNVYTAQTVIDSISITGNRITTTVSNADLELSANGTGIVSIPADNLVVAQNLSVLSGTSTFNSANISGTLTVNNFVTTSNVTAATFSTGDIEISGNVIRTTQTNSNLELRGNSAGSVYVENLSVNNSTISGLNPSENITLTPSGSGIVQITGTQALRIPQGTDAQRPVSSQAGMIRFNSTINQFEGYTGSQWMQLGGISDVDRNTYIIPELTPGSNENTLYFYTNGALAATLNSSYFNVNQLLVDDIRVDGNVISTVSSNSNLDLLPNGSGAVTFNNLRFSNNTLTNVTSGAVTEFKSTGTGYYHIVGNNAFVIPAGSNSDRPGGPVIGMMRYNTDLGLVEIYDGLVWASVAGAASGITAAQAQDISVASALIFG